MRLCYCGEPTEAERYHLCKKCWWKEDPRNPENAKPKKKFRVEIVDTIQWVYEVEAENEDQARFLVEYGRVEPKDKNHSSEKLPVREIK